MTAKKRTLIALTGPLISNGFTGISFDKTKRRKDRETVDFNCCENIKFYIDYVKSNEDKYSLVYLAWDSDYKFLCDEFGDTLNVINVGEPKSKYRAKWQFEPFVAETFKNHVKNGNFYSIFRIRADIKLDMKLVSASLSSLGNIENKIIVPYIASKGKMQDFYFGGTPEYLIKFCQNISNNLPDIYGAHYDALLCQTVLGKFRFSSKISIKLLRLLSKYIGKKIQIPLDKKIYDSLEWRGEKFRTLYGHM